MPSFLHRKYHLFDEPLLKKHRPAVRESSHMQSVRSCGDLRAWNIDDGQRREYIKELIQVDSQTEVMQLGTMINLDVILENLFNNIPNARQYPKKSDKDCVCKNCLSKHYGFKCPCEKIIHEPTPQYQKLKSSICKPCKICYNRNCKCSPTSTIRCNPCPTIGRCILNCPKRQFKPTVSNLTEKSNTKIDSNSLQSPLKRTSFSLKNKSNFRGTSQADTCEYNMKNVEKLVSNVRILQEDANKILHSSIYKPFSNFERENVASTSLCYCNRNSKNTEEIIHEEKMRFVNETINLSQIEDNDIRNEGNLVKEEEDLPEDSNNGNMWGGNQVDVRLAFTKSIFDQFPTIMSNQFMNQKKLYLDSRSKSTPRFQLSKPTSANTFTNFCQCNYSQRPKSAPSSSNNSSLSNGKNLPLARSRTWSKDYSSSSVSSNRKCVKFNPELVVAYMFNTNEKHPFQSTSNTEESSGNPSNSDIESQPSLDKYEEFKQILLKMMIKEEVDQVMSSANENQQNQLANQKTHTRPVLEKKLEDKDFKSIIKVRESKKPLKELVLTPTILEYLIPVCSKVERRKFIHADMERFRGHLAKSTNEKNAKNIADFIIVLNERRKKTENTLRMESLKEEESIDLESCCDEIKPKMAAIELSDFRTRFQFYNKFSGYKHKVFGNQPSHRLHLSCEDSMQEHRLSNNRNYFRLKKELSKTMSQDKVEMILNYMNNSRGKTTRKCSQDLPEDTQSKFNDFPENLQTYKRPIFFHEDKKSNNVTKPWKHFDSEAYKFEHDLSEKFTDEKARKIKNLVYKSQKSNENFSKMLQSQNDQEIIDKFRLKSQRDFPRLKDKDLENTKNKPNFLFEENSEKTVEKMKSIEESVTRLKQALSKKFSDDKVKKIMSLIQQPKTENELEKINENLIKENDNDFNEDIADTPNKYSFERLFEFKGKMNKPKEILEKYKEFKEKSMVRLQQGQPNFLFEQQKVEAPINKEEYFRSKSTELKKELSKKFNKDMTKKIVDALVKPYEAEKPKNIEVTKKLSQELDNGYLKSESSSFNVSKKEVIPPASQKSENFHHRLSHLRLDSPPDFIHGETKTTISTSKKIIDDNFKRVQRELSKKLSKEKVKLIMNLLKKSGTKVEDSSNYYSEDDRREVSLNRSLSIEKDITEKIETVPSFPGESVRDENLPVVSQELTTKLKNRDIKEQEPLNLETKKINDEKKTEKGLLKHEDLKKFTEDDILKKSQEFDIKRELINENIIFKKENANVQEKDDGLILYQAPIKTIENNANRSISKEILVAAENRRKNLPHKKAKDDTEELMKYLLNPQKSNQKSSEGIEIKTKYFGRKSSSSVFDPLFIPKPLKTNLTMKDLRLKNNLNNLTEIDIDKHLNEIENENDEEKILDYLLEDLSDEKVAIRSEQEKINESNKNIDGIGEQKKENNDHWNDAKEAKILDYLLDSPSRQEEQVPLLLEVENKPLSKEELLIKAQSFLEFIGMKDNVKSKIEEDSKLVPSELLKDDDKTFYLESNETEGIKKDLLEKNQFENFEEKKDIKDKMNEENFVKNGELEKETFKRQRNDFSSRKREEIKSNDKNFDSKENENVSEEVVKNLNLKPLQNEKKTNMLLITPNKNESKVKENFEKFDYKPPLIGEANKKMHSTPQFDIIQEEISQVENKNTFGDENLKSEIKHDKNSLLTEDEKIYMKNKTMEKEKSKKSLLKPKLSGNLIKKPSHIPNRTSQTSNNKSKISLDSIERTTKKLSSSQLSSKTQRNPVQEGKTKKSLSPGSIKVEEPIKTAQNEVKWKRSEASTIVNLEVKKPFKESERIIKPNDYKVTKANLSPKVILSSESSEKILKKEITDSSLKIGLIKDNEIEQNTKEKVLKKSSIIVSPKENNPLLPIIEEVNQIFDEESTRNVPEIKKTRNDTEIPKVGVTEKLILKEKDELLRTREQKTDTTKKISEEEIQKRSHISLTKSIVNKKISNQKLERQIKGHDTTNIVKRKNVSSDVLRTPISQMVEPKLKKVSSPKLSEKISLKKTDRKLSPSKLPLTIEAKKMYLKQPKVVDLDKITDKTEKEQTSQIKSDIKDRDLVVKPEQNIKGAEQPAQVKEINASFQKKNLTENTQAYDDIMVVERKNKATIPQYNKKAEIPQLKSDAIEKSPVDKSENYIKDEQLSKMEEMNEYHQNKILTKDFSKKITERDILYDNKIIVQEKIEPPEVIILPKISETKKIPILKSERKMIEPETINIDSRKSIQKEIRKESSDVVIEKQGQTFQVKVKEDAIFLPKVIKTNKIEVKTPVVDLKDKPDKNNIEEDIMRDIIDQEKQVKEFSLIQKENNIQKKISSFKNNANEEISDTNSERELNPNKPLKVKEIKNLSQKEILKENSVVVSKEKGEKINEIKVAVEEYNKTKDSETRNVDPENKSLHKENQQEKLLNAATEKEIQMEFSNTNDNSFSPTVVKTKKIPVLKSEKTIKEVETSKKSEIHIENNISKPNIILEHIEKLPKLDDKKKVFTALSPQSTMKLTKRQSKLPVKADSRNLYKEHSLINNPPFVTVPDFKVSNIILPTITPQSSTIDEPKKMSLKTSNLEKIRTTSQPLATSTPKSSSTSLNEASEETEIPVMPEKIPDDIEKLRHNAIRQEEVHFKDDLVYGLDEDKADDVIKAMLAYNKFQEKEKPPTQLMMPSKSRSQILKSIGLVPENVPPDIEKFVHDVPIHTDPIIPVDSSKEVDKFIHRDIDNFKEQLISEVGKKRAEKLIHEMSMYQTNSHKPQMNLHQKHVEPENKFSRLHITYSKKSMVNLKQPESFRDETLTVDRVVYSDNRSSENSSLKNQEAKTIQSKTGPISENRSQTVPHQNLPQNQIRQEEKTLGDPSSQIASESQLRNQKLSFVQSSDVNQNLPQESGVKVGIEATTKFPESINNNSPYIVKNMDAFFPETQETANKKNLQGDINNFGGLQQLVPNQIVSKSTVRPVDNVQSQGNQATILQKVAPLNQMGSVSSQQNQNFIPPTNKMKEQLVVPSVIQNMQNKSQSLGPQNLIPTVIAPKSDIQSSIDKQMEKQSVASQNLISPSNQGVKLPSPQMTTDSQRNFPGGNQLPVPRNQVIPQTQLKFQTQNLTPSANQMRGMQPNQGLPEARENTQSRSQPLGPQNVISSKGSNKSVGDQRQENQNLSRQLAPDVNRQYQNQNPPPKSQNQLFSPMQPTGNSQLQYLAPSANKMGGFVSQQGTPSYEKNIPSGSQSLGPQYVAITKNTNQEVALPHQQAILDTSGKLQDRSQPPRSQNFNQNQIFPPTPLSSNFQPQNQVHSANTMGGLPSQQMASISKGGQLLEPQNAPQQQITKGNMQMQYQENQPPRPLNVISHPPNVQSLVSPGNQTKATSSQQGNLLTGSPSLKPQNLAQKQGFGATQPTLYPRDNFPNDGNNGINNVEVRSSQPAVDQGVSKSNVQTIGQISRQTNPNQNNNNMSQLVPTSKGNLKSIGNLQSESPYKEESKLQNFPKNSAPTFHNQNIQPVSSMGTNVQGHSTENRSQNLRYDQVKSQHLPNEAQIPISGGQTVVPMTKQVENQQDNFQKEKLQIQGQSSLASRHAHPQSGQLGNSQMQTVVSSKGNINDEKRLKQPSNQIQVQNQQHGQVDTFSKSGLNQQDNNQISQGSSRNIQSQGKFQQPSNIQNIQPGTSQVGSHRYPQGVENFQGTTNEGQFNQDYESQMQDQNYQLDQVSTRNIQSQNNMNLGPSMNDVRQLDETQILQDSHEHFQNQNQFDQGISTANVARSSQIQSQSGPNKSFENYPHIIEPENKIENQQLLQEKTLTAPKNYSNFQDGVQSNSTFDSKSSNQGKPQKDSQNIPQNTQGQNKSFNFEQNLGESQNFPSTSMQPTENFQNQNQFDGSYAQLERQQFSQVGEAQRPPQEIFDDQSLVSEPINSQNKNFGEQPTSENVQSFNRSGQIQQSQYQKAVAFNPNAAYLEKEQFRTQYPRDPGNEEIYRALSQKFSDHTVQILMDFIENPELYERKNLSYFDQTEYLTPVIGNGSLSSKSINSQNGNQSDIPNVFLSMSQSDYYDNTESEEIKKMLGEYYNKDTVEHMMDYIQNPDKYGNNVPSFFTRTGGVEEYVTPRQDIQTGRPFLIDNETNTSFIMNSGEIRHCLICKGDQFLYPYTSAICNNDAMIRNLNQIQRNVVSSMLRELMLIFDCDEENNLISDEARFLIEKCREKKIQELTEIDLPICLTCLKQIYMSLQMAQLAKKKDSNNFITPCITCSSKSKTMISPRKDDVNGTPFQYEVPSNQPNVSTLSPVYTKSQEKEHPCVTCFPEDKTKADVSRQNDSRVIRNESVTPSITSRSRQCSRRPRSPKQNYEHIADRPCNEFSSCQYQNLSYQIPKEQLKAQTLSTTCDSSLNHPLINQNNFNVINKTRKGQNNQADSKLMNSVPSNTRTFVRSSSRPISPVNNSVLHEYSSSADQSPRVLANSENLEAKIDQPMDDQYGSCSPKCKYRTENEQQIKKKKEPQSNQPLSTHYPLSQSLFESLCSNQRRSRSKNLHQTDQSAAKKPDSQNDEESQKYARTRLLSPSRPQSPSQSIDQCSPGMSSTWNNTAESLNSQYPNNARKAPSVDTNQGSTQQNLDSTNLTQKKKTFFQSDKDNLTNQTELNQPKQSFFQKLKCAPCAKPAIKSQKPESTPINATFAQNTVQDKVSPITVPRGNISGYSSPVVSPNQASSSNSSQWNSGYTSPIRNSRPTSPVNLLRTDNSEYSSPSTLWNQKSPINLSLATYAGYTFSPTGQNLVPPMKIPRTQNTDYSSTAASQNFVSLPTNLWRNNSRNVPSLSNYNQASPANSMKYSSPLTGQKQDFGVSVSPTNSANYPSSVVDQSQPFWSSNRPSSAPLAMRNWQSINGNRNISYEQPYPSRPTSAPHYLVPASVCRNPGCGNKAIKGFCSRCQKLLQSSIGSRNL